tara:strand:- start:1643 stop:2491 length:849 start_codon:yes stop_codon:yes gene_type:complete
MTANQIIDGKSIAQALRSDIAKEVSDFPSQPGLAVILVGDDAASQVYVRNKIKATEKAGMRSFEHRFPSHASQAAIASMIETLNHDPDVHGILLQLPLPAHLDSDALIQTIRAEKDVDGLTFLNMGKLIAGEASGLIPCTPQGSLKLIQSVCDDLSGKHAVIIGRSLLFGKPMGQLLLQQNCTVTQCHSRTKDLSGICRQADILIAAVGRPQMVKADWVKEGAIVIDVGINRLEDGSLVGDVDFDAVKDKAGAVTPVPGGVGPMTIACLLENTAKAYQALNR